MATVEYAVGTVAACGFASLLWWLQVYYHDALVSVLSVVATQVRAAWPGMR